MSVIGLKVGPFEIVRRAWVPGPGRWYLARGDGDPREILVRVVPQDGGGDEHRAVQHQFEVLREIGDDRIPTPIGHYGIVPGSPSIGALAVVAAMGAPLSDAIALRGDESVVMTPGTLLDLLLEIAQALERAHARGRVHGHLDPENVVLGPDGRVWVFGFGTDLEEEPNDRLIAPEQARGTPPTPETDQWALGALALGLVLGHPVWREDDRRAEAARGDASGPVEAVGQQWPALGRVLERMTDPRPQGRYASMTAVREDSGELARIAGSRSDRAALGASLCARRLEAAAPEEVDLFADAQRAVHPTPERARSQVVVEVEGGAPTAVPLTDADVDDRGSESGRMKVHRAHLDDLPPMTDPGASGLGRARLPAFPRSLAELSILQLAPILAGTMVVLLVVWLIVNLL